MNPSTLTPLQQRFCDEYFKDFNGRAAAVRAGYAPKHAKSQAYDLLRLPKVAQCIDAKLEASRQATEVKAAELLQQYMHIAFFNIKTLFDENNRLLPPDKLPPDAAAAVKKIEVRRVYDKDGAACTDKSRVVKIVPHKKMKALNALARHLRLFDAEYQETQKKGNKHIYIDWDPVEKRSVRREVWEESL